MKRLRWVFQCALCLVAGACLGQTESSMPPAEIVLGMSTALSGPVAALGQAMRQGVLAGLERANRSGGINGHKLRLIALDDGYEPARTVPNMRRLIAKENVLAVIGNVGTPTAVAALPIADEQKTLFFAPFTGSAKLRIPLDRYVINFRASYAEETAAMIDALIDVAGLKPEEIAFFIQSDSYGFSAFADGVAALKRHGLRDEKAVVPVLYERNTLAVENSVADLLFTDQPPRAVVMVGAYAPCAKFIKLCREADLNAVFLNVSFVGSEALAEALGKTDAHVIVTQVVPFPMDDRIAIVREYKTDLNALEPAASVGFGDLEGYIAARILTTALNTMEGPPTREGLVDALEGLGQFDLGLGAPLRLSPAQRQACHRIWPTILKDGAFVPLQWPAIADLFKKEALR